MTALFKMGERNERLSGNCAGTSAQDCSGHVIDSVTAGPIAHWYCLPNLDLIAEISHSPFDLFAAFAFALGRRFRQELQFIW